MLSDALAAQGTTGLPTDTGGASDHFSFEINGIPTSGLFSGIEALTDEPRSSKAQWGCLPTRATTWSATRARTSIRLLRRFSGAAMASVLERLAY